MTVLCIYHANCQDGFGAAWAVRQALGDKGVAFHPANYGEDPPESAGCDVVIVDFSYPLPVLQTMAARANSVLVVDHHKSAAEDLAGLLPAPGSDWGSWRAYLESGPRTPDRRLCASFDMERSGAGLAWDFFSPRQTRPPLVDHIEDRDLWRFALPGTREITASIFSYPYEFEVWDRLAEMPVGDLEREGRAILRKHDADIAMLLPVLRRRMVIGGIDMPVANLPATLISDAANQMAEAADGVAACYFDTASHRVFSLRSTEAGPDVSEIARRYGGGGHFHAAGFRRALGWEGDGRA